LVYLISIATGLSTLFNFIVQTLLAREFGLGYTIDIYLVALSFPTFIIALISSGYSYGLVPELVQVSKNPEIKLLVQVLLLFSFLVAIFCFLLSFLINFQVNSNQSFFGFEIKEKNNLFIFAWFYGGFQIILSSVITILNSEKKYLITFFFLIISQTGILLPLVFLDEPKIDTVMMGLLFGSFFGACFGLYYISKHLKNIFELTKNLILINLKKISSNMIIGIVASSMFGIYVVIDMILAPLEGEGTLATIGYAQRIIIGFGNISIYGVFMISSPELKELLLTKGLISFKKHLWNLTSKAFLLSFLTSLGIYFFIEIFIEIFFKSDNFIERDVILLSEVVKIMLPGMIAMLMTTILTKALFCLANIKNIALALGILWPIIYVLGISLSPLEGALKFGSSYTSSWIIIFLILIVYFVKRKNV
tara:strand:- start:8676 stop:9938 length:1263 start_codon:yes stop_codon:yes gene_type:complete